MYHILIITIKTRKDEKGFQMLTYSGWIRPSGTPTATAKNAGLSIYVLYVFNGFAGANTTDI